jgi:hypothetical protein
MVSKPAVLVICLMIPVMVFAQADTSKTILEKYRDSIKHSTYPYTFPAWGEKIVKKGIDLPLPAGVMINYFAASQLINITDLQVGFNNGPMVPLDFIKFGTVKANIQSISSRFDVWLLPFVNVYGMFGATLANTSVSVVAPFNFSTSAKFNGTTAGFGVALAGAWHGIFGDGDYNNTWSSLDNIQGSVYTQTVDLRLGHPFIFASRPDRNITLWVGGSGIYIGRTTEGTIPLSSLSTDATQAELQQIKDGTAAWVQTLSPAQQVVVKQIANAFLDKISGLDIKDASISYSLIKRATSNWSMLAGGQFQLNRRWQFRSEAGFLGGRTSVLCSANYRFGF